MESRLITLLLILCLLEGMSNDRLTTDPEHNPRDDNAVSLGVEQQANQNEQEVNENNLCKNKNKQKDNDKKHANEQKKQDDKSEQGDDQNKHGDNQNPPEEDQKRQEVDQKNKKGDCQNIEKYIETPKGPNNENKQKDQKKQDDESEQGDDKNKHKCKITPKGPQNCHLKNTVENTTEHMKIVDKLLDSENISAIMESMESLEEILENTYLNQSITHISVGHLKALMFQPDENFTGLNISEEVTSDCLNDTSMNLEVKLPGEVLVHGENNNIVFCMITSNVFKPLAVLHDRVVGITVSNKTISSLQEPVNITFPLPCPADQSMGTNVSFSCQFLNFSDNNYYREGCSTHYEQGQDRVLCSCNHLTYFAVLMISPPLATNDEVALSYISLIGCCVSLLFLIFTVGLYIQQRLRRVSGPADVSLKLHINLAVALILLNLHFLLMEQVSSMVSSGACIYVGLLLHYSLLATFSWMAIEGFHLYLLLVRIFNIYISRYLLKLCLVGWGFPAVIVIIVVIINRDAYGPVPLSSSEVNTTATKICYLSDEVAKVVTTVGFVSLVLLFNLAILGMAARRVLSMRVAQGGTVDVARGRVRRDLCTFSGISCLLGVTWGLVFFSFGQLATPGLYLFCVLNSLQGFFICVWILVSMRKSSNRCTGSVTHSVTHSTKT
ncbi:adhesion G-protein coupled receptor G5-like isoform X2 [Hypomesus transpacificus]|uniref:adhesion G-protein coupled receptor G5-like isoform X2 n=1 Tax=Hypomesus transpacificus TaxID=137520 RepID=UPI001F082EC1|nr:adhesion G-protein coupled receptor G5-like isoform X2 [Hypomesus transpacificus]